MKQLSTEKAVFWCVALVCMLSSAASAVAQSRGGSDNGRAVEAYLSEEAAQLRFETPTDIGGADSRAAYGLFLSEERDVVASAALLLDSDVELGPFGIRFGPQAYAALLDDENEDVFALALGVEARLDLVRSRGIAIVGSAYYSPDVITFGSADNVQDYMARAEMRLNSNLLGFAGYRWFQLDLLNREERKLQNELFVGVRYQLR